MRYATMADSDYLFAWRNDPDTCATSKSTEAVSPEDHQRWMQYNVECGYPSHIVMIAESDEGSVGVVRFDALKTDVMMYTVGITIAPSLRNRGLGRHVLDEACAQMPDVTLLAEIKEWNLASCKIFTDCGFEKIGYADGIVSYERAPR